MKRVRTLEERITQLDLALKALSNANRHYDQTKDEAYLLDMMGRLRALVGLGGAFMNPLLIDLSKETGIHLEIYSYPPKPKKEVGKKAGALYFTKTWATVPKPGYIKYDLEGWLEAPFYLSDTTKEYKTRNQVIKDIANSQGGSHYADEIPHSVDSLIRQTAGIVDINEVSTKLIDGVQQALLDIAPAIFWLGKRLIFQWQYCNIESSAFISNEYRKNKLQEINNNILNLDAEFERLQISNSPFACVEFFT